MSVMNFNTSNNTFRQLLGNGMRYKVPPFQRDYSWTEEEWDDLWQDSLSLFEPEGDSAHYMGYLVLQSADHKSFEIIDGQQRLTTISVIILAGLSYLQDLIDSNIDPQKNRLRQQNLRSSYIGFVDPVSLVSQSKLALNRHNDRFYQTYLVPLDKLPQRGLNASEHQLRKAFTWFKSQFKQYLGNNTDSGEKFAFFIDSWVDKLFFTVITVTDELNAFKVFETLNARGVRLSATDLLKNYLFSLIHTSTTHQAELKALEDRWERIVGLLSSESFPEFLRVFWNSRHKLVRKSDLFKTIRRKISTREEAFALLRELDQSAEIYAALRDPRSEMWSAEETQYLEQLIMFSVRQPLSMLLACHEQLFLPQRQSFTRILRAISVISFRYNIICSLPTHEQERIYNDIAQKVSNKTYAHVNAILGALRELYPEDAIFKTLFSNKSLRTTNSRNKKIVRYILFEIDRQESNQVLDFDSATYNLEHILPENPSEDWNLIDESVQERMIYRLGNMTPLETSYNKELGNKDFKIKSKVYEKSAFLITRAISEHYDQWNEEKLTSRQEKMAKTATSIWRIEFGGKN